MRLLALPSPQIVQLCLHRPFGRIPKLFVNVEVDVFDDLADRGVVTEIPQRGAYLLQTFVPVQQVSRCNRFQVEQVRPVPRQHGPPAQATQPVQRFQVVG